MSDQLIQYLTAQRKSGKWYKKLFLHFLDIAATNAFILHKEPMHNMGKEGMNHKQFQEELTAQFCGVLQTFLPLKAPLQTAGEIHRPVCGIKLSSDGTRTRDGRRACVYCKRQGRITKTLWKSDACYVYLCLQQDRNCYVAWHRDGNC